MNVVKSILVAIILAKMAASLTAQFNPGTMYYNPTNGNFGLGTDAPQTYLHLKNSNPILTFMSTSAGQTVDNDGSNNGWTGVSFMAPSTKNGTPVLVWDFLYSARDKQLYLYDYTGVKKVMSFPNNGVPVINGGVSVIDSSSNKDIFRVNSNGNVGIGTSIPEAKLEVSGNTILRGPVTLKGYLGIGYDADGLGKLSFHSTHTAPGNRYYTGIIYNNSAGNLSYESSDVGNVQVQFGSDVNYGTLSFQSMVWDAVQSKKTAMTRMVIKGNSGNVGIGTTLPSAMLHVAGDAKVDGSFSAANLVVSVDQWADKVFEPGYVLMPLNQVDKYVRQHHHLPEVPSEAEIKQRGMNIAQMQAIHMQKIEELTLYVIQLQKENDILRKRLDKLELRVK